MTLFAVLTMSSSNNPAIIHLRDFVEAVGPDPTRLDQQAAIQLQIALNIPPVQPDEQSDDLDICSIPTLVRVYTLPGQSPLYQQDVFTYVMGSFSMLTLDGQPQMTVNAYTSDWSAPILSYLFLAYTDNCFTKATPVTLPILIHI
jgi:hypothetical protein